MYPDTDPYLESLYLGIRLVSLDTGSKDTCRQVGYVIHVYK